MGKQAVLPIVFSLCLAGVVFSQETGKPNPAPPVPSAKPSATVEKGDAARGKQIFENTCDECHDAYSREERVGPGLQGLKSGKLPDGRPATHDKLLDIVNNGPAEMPAFRDRLTEQQKEDVVAFVMTL
jgi:mono/diheme cytochrome c family protein